MGENPESSKLRCSAEGGGARPAALRWRRNRNARPREQPERTESGPVRPAHSLRAWGLQKHFPRRNRTKIVHHAPCPPLNCHPLSTLYSETLYCTGWLLLFPIYLCVKCIYHFNKKLHAVSHEVRRRGQWASRGAPGKSGLHASGEGERVIAPEPW